MGLNRITNLNLDVVIKSPNSSLVLSGVVVKQYLKVYKPKQLSYGSTTITDGFIIKNNTTTVSTPVITGSGTSNEVTTSTFSSIVPYKKAVKIATIRIVPDSNFKVVKKASIKITSNNTNAKVYLRETSIANLYNLICNIKESTINNFVCDIDYLVSSIAVVTNNINRISFKSSILNTIGQNKEIKIYGSPNVPFKLSILNSSNNSILSSANSTDVTPIGVVNCVSETLNKKGYYTWRQKFPSIPTIRQTTINGTMAVSGATQITFHSLTNVLVGDQVFILGTDNKMVNYGDTIKVVSIDSTYVCTLSASITAADDTPAVFKRATSYKVNVSTTGILNSSIPSTFPTYTFNQYLNPVLTVIATTTASGARINGLIAGVADSDSITGKVKQKETGSMQLIYELTGKTFTLASGHPVASDWTTTSGDTTFSVYDFRVTGAGTVTCTIYARISVIQWGVNDTVVNLNLDNIIS